MFLLCAVLGKSWCGTPWSPRAPMIFFCNRFLSKAFHRQDDSQEMNKDQKKLNECLMVVTVRSNIQARTCNMLFSLKNTLPKVQPAQSVSKQNRHDCFKN